MVYQNINMVINIIVTHKLIKCRFKSWTHLKLQQTEPTAISAGRHMLPLCKVASAVKKRVKKRTVRRTCAWYLRCM